MMKTLISFIAFLILSIHLNAQVAINTDGSDPDASAMLEVKSTGKGFLLPRMTTTERDAISSPAEGLMIYNTDEICIQFFNGICWETPGWECGEDVTFTYNGSSVTYGTVRSCCNCWLDRNLGADQVATSSTDYNAYGSLFQWGRLDDGHELISWTNSTTGSPVNTQTNIQSSTPQPGHNHFIIDFANWYTGSNQDEFWQGVGGTNNPCPEGFRLPTESELSLEMSNWASQDAAGAFASPLKLTLAGYHHYLYMGALEYNGVQGRYWTSTYSSPSARRLYFGSGYSGIGYDSPGRGNSVRCIKD